MCFWTTNTDNTAHKQHNALHVRFLPTNQIEPLHSISFPRPQSPITYLTPPSTFFSKHVCRMTWSPLLLFNKFPVLNQVPTTTNMSSDYDNTPTAESTAITGKSTAENNEFRLPWGRLYAAVKKLQSLGKLSSVFVVCLSIAFVLFCRSGGR